jgi:hypothetical protein
VIGSLCSTGWQKIRPYRLLKKKGMGHHQCKILISSACQAKRIETQSPSMSSELELYCRRPPWFETPGNFPSYTLGRMLACPYTFDRLSHRMLPLPYTLGPFSQRMLTCPYTFGRMLACPYTFDRLSHRMLPLPYTLGPFSQRMLTCPYTLRRVLACPYTLGRMLACPYTF